MVRKRFPAERRACFESLEHRNLMASDLTPANVLVLYNSASQDGTAIANYFAQVHPGVHMLGITGIDPTSENISADAYLSTIRPQILSALTPAIDVIVTTKGLPLRINITESPPPLGSSYVDAFGNTRQIYEWQKYSSLESELTRVDSISTWQMMGDQTTVQPNEFTVNPYYRSNADFSFASFGIRLTSRLDGYTVADVEASIDRAQRAYIGPFGSPNGPYYFLIDNDPTVTYPTTMASLVNNTLVPDGLPLVYDNTTAWVNTAPGPVIAYDSQGIHQSTTPSNYITDGMNFSLADGAVFESWESYNAYSFDPTSTQHLNQGQVAQWLERGGTAAVGNVEEPLASLYRVTNEDQMFAMLLGGHTFVEAAWSATYQLSYVNTMIGDPLMTWKPLPPATSIVGRSLFYNNSSWDGHTTGANASDDAAIAIDKSAYLPGSGAATFADVSSYSKGINGVMIDINGPHGTIAADDFIFRVGNNNAPDTWATAPAPTTVLVRAGAGLNGSDRVELIWADYAIKKQWLQITVKGNDTLGGHDPDTGLAASDVFYFGNAVGDTGGGDSATAALVTGADMIQIMANQAVSGKSISIANVYDVNRDRQVSGSDIMIAQANQTTNSTALAFIVIPALSAATLPAALPGALSAATTPGASESPGNAVASALAAMTTGSASNGPATGPPRQPGLSALDNAFPRPRSLPSAVDLVSPRSRPLAAETDAVADGWGMDSELLDSLVRGSRR